MFIPIAALFVNSSGAYYGIDGIDPWDEERDARKYDGSAPAICHPPCQRWGRFWHGSPSKPHQFKRGDDNGCFQSALGVITSPCGGIIEHPADSYAWVAFGINKPPRSGGWIPAFELRNNVWTCCVHQGHYGHVAGKATWLIVSGLRFDQLPELRWGKCEQRLDPIVLERHGYEVARRRGMVSLIGGKDKTTLRNATSVEFRDLLVKMARLIGDPDEGL